MEDNYPAKPVDIEAGVRNRLRLLRREHNFTYREVSRRLKEVGVSIPFGSLRQLEQDDDPRSLRVNEVFGFAAIYEVPVEQLLGLEGRAQSSRDDLLYTTAVHAQMRELVEALHRLKWTTSKLWADSKHNLEALDVLRGKVAHAPDYDVDLLTTLAQHIEDQIESIRDQETPEEEP